MAAQPSRCCARDCRRSTPTTSSTGTASRSTRRASAWPSARRPAACGSRKTRATAGIACRRTCRRSTPCALLRAAASAALLALIALALAWELWLAPLRPGGSLLALKALPPVPPLGGVLQGPGDAEQWASMLTLAYLAEGVTPAWGDTGLARQLAIAEMVLSLAFCAAAVSYVRRSRGAA